MKESNLKQKIAQMFITGYQGTCFKKCPEFVELLNNGLGGVIFFAQNIDSVEQFKSEIENIKSVSPQILLSIDQEGGRVERTLNIHNGSKYLSAKFAAQKGEGFLKTQTDTMLQELQNYGINMNFAPVLDVNTEIQNPIIGERAYSDKTEEVIKYSQIVLNEYKKFNIIPVGKHFPGHGAAQKDSHLTLPQIDIPFDELQNTHIKPFKCAIENGLNAIMVAHVHYCAIDNDNIPASVSENVMQKILRNQLNFQGVIISDDMVMGGIQNYTPFEACKRAILAGVNMFIYRNTDETVLRLIDELEDAVRTGEIDEKLIDNSNKLIFEMKKIVKLPLL